MENPNTETERVNWTLATSRAFVTLVFITILTNYSKSYNLQHKKMVIPNSKWKTGLGMTYTTTRVSLIERYVSST